MPDLDTIHIFRYFLMAGPLIGAMCALLSVYVVLRRMAMISEGVAHAGFGGMGAAIVLGFFLPLLDNPYWQVVVTGAFCLCTSLLIGWVSRRKRVSEDSAIGIFLAATVAVGTILITYRSHLGAKYDAAGKLVSRLPPSIDDLLFGQFTQVVRDDVILLAIVAALVFTIIFALYHQFLYTTLDEEMARINGVNTRLVNTLLLVMISLVICICVRLVGALMITALMIIPGATANMISRRFSGVLLASLLIGTLGTSAATWAVLLPKIGSYPPGPVVVLVLFACFAVVWAYRQFVKPKVLAPDAGIGTAVQAKEPGAFGHGHSH